MYDGLKKDFSSLTKILEEKEARVSVLEDRLREADYDVSWSWFLNLSTITNKKNKQLLKGKSEYTSTFRKNSKRLLVTSDYSFFDRPDQEIGTDNFNQSLNSQIIHSNGIGQEPVTPQNQKTRTDTSPSKLATPTSVNIELFAAVEPKSLRDFSPIEETPSPVQIRAQVDSKTTRGKRKKRNAAKN